MPFKNYSRPKRILIILSLSLFVILLLLVAVAEYTSRPKFCTTCHYMEPFYQSWATSSHKDVACVKCHYAPGFKSVIETKTVGLVHLVTYVTEFYKRSKPTAEVNDASCLRSGCHEARLLSGREKFNRVYFDHAPHLMELRRGKKLRCTSCHSQIVQGDHMKVTESTCFLCHFKAGPGDPKIHNCRFCHEAPTRENSTAGISYDHSAVIAKNIACERCHTMMVVGDGAVPLENCYNCHWEQDRLDRRSDTDFMHKTHITNHKIECQQCHSPIQHKLPEKENLHLLDCASCHVDPHKAQTALFTGTGGYHAHPVPNPMFNKSITCKGCHIFHEEADTIKINGGTFRASKASCENCHGKGFDRLLNVWQNLSQQKLAAITQDFHNAYNHIAHSASSKKSEALKLMSEAKYNIDLVDMGKSVHNVQFADELLKGAHEIITQSLKLVGSNFAIRPYQKTSKFVPAECNSCHFDVVVASKSVFGLEFSHQRHVVDRQQDCKACHSNDRRHGELTMTKSKCATCHHQENTRDCSTCHVLQFSVYSGTLDKVKYPTVVPDMMFQAGVECTGCHNYEINHSVTPSTKSCLECHQEESYVEIYNNWRENSSKAIDSIEKWLSESSNQKLTQQQKDQVNWVKAVLTLVTTDNSEGVHNPKFYESILKQCQDILKQISVGGAN